MMNFEIGQQFHGYKSGHQLLHSSIRLAPSDQEVVDRISDMSGPLRPSEHFDSYLTAYPLPSREYYVLARTEQDLEAPRAGCVRTKSLIIPLEYWASQADPAGLIASLGAADVRLFKGSAETTNLPIMPVADAGGALVELSEALFLEKRVPVVMFEMPEAFLVSQRLLTSLWPAARSNFSLCTYALSPRQLGSKPFDLLFAPRSARSRFSDWEGRRIEGGHQAHKPRHQWSRLISDRIFESAVPHLVDQAALHQLGAERDSSENVLRLSLLWDDLLEKGTSSPTAVLGLLDIANSRNSTSASWPILQPAISNAINVATVEIPPSEAWGFIRALLGKTASLGARESILDDVGRAIRTLVPRDYDATFIALVDLDLDEGAEAALIEAIAPVLDGADQHVLANGLVRLSGQQIGEFCVRSLACRKAVMHPDEEIDALSAFDKLVETVEIDVDLTARLRPVMLPYVERQEHARLLALLLKRATDQEILEAVSLIWKKASAHRQPIASILIDLSIERNLRVAARDEVAATGSDAATDTLLLDLSGNTKIDLDWFLTSAVIEKRRATLLCVWLSRQGDQTLEAFVSDEKLAERVLSTLLSVDTPALSLIVRLLTRDHIPSRALMDVGLRIYGATSGNDRKRLAGKLVYRAVTDAKIETPLLLEKVLSQTYGSYDFSVVVNEGLAKARSGAFASRLLEAVDKSDAKVRLEAVSRIETIAAAISRRTMDLNERGVDALCSLLNDRKVPVAARLRASSLLLSAAMLAFRNKAAPAIILATFPSLYEELRKDDDRFDIWRLFVLTDWDKCKTARRDLVKAFLQSDWAPIDLALVAGATRDPDRIFKRLLKEPKGPSFFREIVKEANRLPSPLKSLVADLSKSLGKRGSTISDWET